MRRRNGFAFKNLDWIHLRSPKEHFAVPKKGDSYIMHKGLRVMIIKES